MGTNNQYNSGQLAALCVCHQAINMYMYVCLHTCRKNLDLITHVYMYYWHYFACIG